MEYANEATTSYSHSSAITMPYPPMASQSDSPVYNYQASNYVQQQQHPHGYYQPPHVRHPDQYRDSRDSGYNRYGPVRNQRQRNRGRSKPPVSQQRIDVWRDRVSGVIENRVGRNWMTERETSWVSNFVQVAIDYDRLMLVRFSSPGIFELVMRICADFFVSPKKNTPDDLKRMFDHRPVTAFEAAMKWSTTSVVDEIIECNRRNCDNERRVEKRAETPAPEPQVTLAMATMSEPEDGEITDE